MFKHKQYQKEGNDCLIMKTATLQPVGKKYAVTVLSHYYGGWCANHPLSVEMYEFETGKEANDFFVHITE